MSMYYLGFWKKAEDISVEQFEKKMRKFNSQPSENHEALARILLEHHAFAGEYRGIEVIEVRGRGSDKALIKRMNQLKPEVEIRWEPLIKLSRMLEIE